MRTPKSLIQLADSINARIEEISFRMHGRFLPGFAVVDQDDNELLVLEPLFRNGADRWLVNNKCGKGISYIKSLRGFTADIKPMHTGFKFSKPTI